MQLLTGPEYYCQLLKSLQTAEHRILLNAMVVIWDANYMQSIFDALVDARQRGLEVVLVLDTFSFLPVAVPGGFRPSFLPRRRHTKQALRQLCQAGVTIHYTGRGHLNPYQGRYHAKISVVDDYFFSFGGINLGKEFFASNDLMLFGHDSEIADYLWRLVHNFTLKKLKADRTHTLNTSNQILFDHGQPGTSIIYEKACQLASKAQRIWYVSQLCPTGKLATILREKNALCYFNQPSNVDFPVSLSIKVDQKKTGLNNHYHSHHFVHAKFILFELPGNVRVLLTGSNNFNWRGIKYGTPEIALLSYESKLWQQFYDYTLNLNEA